MEDEFIISRSKLPLFQQYQSHISSLFAVCLQISTPGTFIPANYGSLIWIKVKSGSPELSLQQQQQDVKSAKEYILSLTGDNEDCCTESLRLSPERFDWLQRHVTEIEINSRAVISLHNDDSSVQIHGHPENRALAHSCIDFLLQGNASRESTSLIPDAQMPAGFKSRGEMGGHRTKLPLPQPCLSPGADSCYGSSDDCLACPPPPPPRTDKPCVREPQIPSTPGSTSPSAHSDSPPSSDPELDTIKSDSYLSKLQFGIRLGFSEAQVSSVLQKRGIDVPQNELLSELVSLGSGSHMPPTTSRVSGNLDSGDMDSGWLSGSGAGVESSGVTGESGSKTELSLPLTTDNDLSSHNTDTSYRPIVIDGSNVAMSHGNKAVFSCRGIQLAVDWFKKKGCKDITVFVPQWRKESPRQDAPIDDQHILTELEQEQILSFTPARRIGGKRMVCYDDRYVLKLAAEIGGIVVSNDNYRDLLEENKEFKRVVEERLLMYSFVRDMFMPPDDPLGRHGPSLENFLRKEPTEPEPKPPPCPYGKKCTYGNKCKYYHAERGNLPQKTITEKLAEQAKQNLLEVTERSKTDKKKTGKKQKQPEKKVLTRTHSCTTALLSEDLVPPPRPPRKPISSPNPRLSPFSDILDTQAVENPEFKAYNDKLSELSKNIPVDNYGQRTSKDALDVPPGYCETGLWAPPELGKARASPQLVTGHLELAQTLSDEANREQRQKSLLQQQEELKQDLKRGLQPLVYEPSGEDHLQRITQQQLHIQEIPHPRGTSPNHGWPKEDNQQYSQPRYASDLSTSYATSSMNCQNSTSDPMLDKPDVMSSRTQYGHLVNPMFTHRQPSYPQSYHSHQPYNAPSGQYPLGSSSNFVPHGYFQMPGPQLGMMRTEVGSMGTGNWPHQTVPPSSLLSEGSFPADTPILPTDQRYNLYYHLCGLFKEPDVRAIMNRLPNETNPQVLCAHLLSLNH
ncbi:endoribonuclease rege-1-like [Liolophura sinensis]|uniref:endoribonuclease rege-1-like n=1 Tax=Liolophura sinensis TaxID=3198878 RepID=UPI0031593644